jgi:ParB family transcriptional regulator, chromosome partitioning protein
MPCKLHLILLAHNSVGQGSLRFHAEHEIDLVVGTLRHEVPLGHQYALDSVNIEAAFFQELAGKRCSGRFAKLDVPPGKVPIAVGDALAEQDGVSPNQQSAGNDLDPLFHCSNSLAVVDARCYPSLVEEVLMEDSRKTRRLGRGLSGLLSEPVPVGVASEDKLTRSQEHFAIAERGISMIPIGRIVPNDFQPRRVFDQVALERLADSIRRSGVMQPVIVRPHQPSGDSFQLVAGERRWRAAALAELETIPSIVREIGDEEAAEWALVENVQREDLNPMERAWAFQSLVERFGLNHSQIAERVGLDRSSVANTIRLIELESPIRDMISAGRLTAGHGKALLMAPAGPERMKLAEQASDEGWSVRRLERAAAGLTAPAPAAAPGVGRSGPDLARVAARAELERQLGEHLGSKVTITTDRSGARGRLSIEFYGLDHFDGLLAKLGFQMR